MGTFGGAVSGSRARDAKLAKIAPRHSESMIFGVPRGPKNYQKWFRNQLPAATWLQERLGGLWGSILGHFGVHFEVPNRSKNGTENKLIFKRFWGALEIRRPGSVREPVSSYQCINVSRIQRQLVSIYQYNKDTWRQEATILRFSSIRQQGFAAW